jgi:hypothetical protein
VKERARHGLFLQRFLQRRLHSQAAMKAPKVRQKSLSKWAKQNRAMLKNVDFQTPKPNPDDRNWRKRKPYRRWREWCLLRDGHHCQLCGATKSLTVHHIVPAAVCPDLRYDIRNGVTLCATCHQEKSEFLHQMRPRFWKNIRKRR